MVPSAIEAVLTFPPTIMLPLKYPASVYKPYISELCNPNDASVIPNNLPNLTFCVPADWKVVNESIPSIISIYGALSSSDVIYTAP